MVATHPPQSGFVSPATTVPPSRVDTPDSDTRQPPRTKICVYCGALPGNDPKYLQAARDLGRAMAEADIDLVYGGGTVGMMGEVAKTLVALKGPDAVHGVIPEALVRYERDDAYTSVTDGSNGTRGLAIPEVSIFGRSTIVKDMHQRKRLMAQEVIAGGRGSGFVALTGGYGTLEEIAETVTWNQLGIHNKGVCLFNVDGFWDGLLAWIAKSNDQGFIRGGKADILVQADTAEGVIKALRDYKLSESSLKLTWDQE